MEEKKLSLLLKLCVFISTLLTRSLATLEDCQAPLGMEDGRITDAQLSASTIYNTLYYPVTNARLNRPAGGNGDAGSWSALTNNVNEWVQVDLLTPTWVSGVIIQGRADTTQWVTKYKVEYASDNLNWMFVTNGANEELVFTGNIDQYSIVTAMFPSRVLARLIRIRPTEWYSWISMRFELLGSCSESITTASTVMSSASMTQLRTSNALTSTPASTTGQNIRITTKRSNDVTTSMVNTRPIPNRQITDINNKASASVLISTFEAATKTLPSSENLDQTNEYTRQRFKIERNQHVDRQLVLGDLKYNVDIPAEAIQLHDNVGFVVIAVLTSLTPSDNLTFHNNMSNVTYNLATQIVSINLFESNSNLVGFSNERNPIKVTISSQTTMKATGKSSELVCAFWSERNWSQEGVSVVESETNESQLTCLATHLTTFSGLFQLTEQREYSEIVKIITNVGSGASIIALLLGLSCYGILLKSSKLNSANILIHINLMIAMLLAYTFLITSETAPANYYMCLAVTILLLDAFLSVFAWTAVEALHLFRMIVVVYGIERDLKWLYMFIGWGMPLLVTGTTVAIGRGQLIADKPTQCWLDRHYIWAFIGPVVFILLINGVILGIVVQKTISVSAGHNSLQSVKTGLRSMILLLPMLGVAWIAGLAVNVHVSIGYIFDILSSLQGVYLVTVICILNTEIREGLIRKWKKRRNAVDVGQIPMRNTTISSQKTEEVSVEGITPVERPAKNVDVITPVVRSSNNVPKKTLPPPKPPQRDYTPWFQYISDSEDSEVDEALEKAKRLYLMCDTL